MCVCHVVNLIMMFELGSMKNKFNLVSLSCKEMNQSIGKKGNDEKRKQGRGKAR